jgi:hypothetical protein
VTVALNWFVPPVLRLNVDGFTTTEVTLTFWRTENLALADMVGFETEATARTWSPSFAGAV